MSQIGQQLMGSPPGAAGGITAGWELIVDETVAGAAVTSITVLGLDLDTDKAYMILFIAENASGGAVTFNMYFNNDAVDANYHSQYLIVDGGAISNARDNRPTIGYAPVSEQYFGFLVLMRDPDGYARWNSIGNRRPPANIKIHNTAGAWVTTNNVTRIDITASVANAIAIGSSLLIFKVVP